MSSSDRSVHRSRVIAAILVAAVPAVLVVAISLTLGVVGAQNRSGDFRAPADHPVVAAFYGDSFTLGTGIDDRSLRWSTLVSQERDWSEFNPSINGLGFVHDRDRLGTIDVVGQILDQRPQVVVVSLGLNDTWSMPEDADEVQGAIDRDFTALGSMSGTRVIVMEPFWPGADGRDRVDRIAEWVREAADRHGFDYVDGVSHWLDGHPEWLAADDFHPGEAGHAEIAARMSAALTVLGLPPTR